MVADAEGSSYVGGGGNKGEEGLMQASMDKQLTRKQQVCGFGCGGGVCECEGVREWVSGWGCGQCVRGWGGGAGVCGWCRVREYLAVHVQHGVMCTSTCM